MSKYSKHLKDKEYRKLVKQVNKQYTEIHNHNMSKVQDQIDERSTRETFDRWCEECGDELGEFSGVLSIAGSDGTDITDTRLGDAPFNNPAAVDQQLKDDGYYEDGWVNMNSYFYHKPKMSYLEWFRKNYPEI